MKQYTTHQRYIFIGAVGILITSLSLFHFTNATTGPLPPAPVDVGEDIHISIAEQRLMIPVSGVVVPAEMTVLRAQVAGVVRDINVHEGMVVGAGMLLARQIQPVVEQRRVATAFENELHIAAREQARVAAQTAYNEADTTGARERALAEEHYRTVHERKRDATEQAKRELVAARSVMVQAFDYLDGRLFMLSAQATQSYRSLVASLYGRPTSHIGGALLNPERDGVDRPWFSDPAYATGDEDIHEVISHVAVALASVHALRDILVDAERHVLDRRNVDPASPEYALYGTMLSNVHTLERGLGELHGMLRASLDAAAIAERELERAVQGTTAGVAGSGERADSAQVVVERARALEEAVQAVYRAELALGDIRAPFSGQVTALYVERGDLAQPGTPIMTISGSGAREFSVSLPRDLSPMVVPGSRFLSGEAVVGYVDRVVTENVRGTIEVFVVVTDPAFSEVGRVVSGIIDVEVPQEVGIVVSRSAVRFDSMGSYLGTRSGDVVRVAIRYDAGEHLFIVPEVSVDAQDVMPARSVRW